MRENLEREWKALSFPGPLARASLLGMAGAVWCLCLLMVSRFLAVGEVPLRQRPQGDRSPQCPKTQTSATPISVGVLLATNNF